jgi:hypothetical protein
VPKLRSAGAIGLTVARCFSVTRLVDKERRHNVAPRQSAQRRPQTIATNALSCGRRGLIVVDGPTQQARDLTALLMALTMLGRKARHRAIGIVTLLLTSRAGPSPRMPSRLSGADAHHLRKAIGITAIAAETFGSVFRYVAGRAAFRGQGAFKEHWT